MRAFTFMLLAVLTALVPASGQIYNPVKWSFDQKQIDAETYEIQFKAKIESGWSIYSQYLESDDGPIRTSFNFDDGEHFALQGKSIEKSDHRKEGYDKLFDMNVIKFTDEVVFTQVLKVKDPSKSVTGYLEFMTCDATKCLPPAQIDFKFTFSPKTNAGGMGSATPPSTGQKTGGSAGTEKIGTTNSTSTKETQKEPAKVADTKKQEVKKETPSTSTNTTDSKFAETLSDVEETATASIEEVMEETIAMGGGDGLLNPVTWTVEAKKINEQEYDLLLHAKMEDGWYIYSQFLEGEDGPIPSNFIYKTEDGQAELVGKTVEEGPQRVEEYDKNFEMNLIKFKKEATFTQRFKVNDPDKAITGDLEFMTCTSGKCLPPALKFFAFEPATLKSYVGSESERDALFALAAVGPNLDGEILDQARPVLQATYIEPVGNCGEESIATGSLWWIFILGFLGGFVALLTPCVFPMIPLTVSFFTKSSKTRWEGIKNGLIYGASIIVIYVSIGLLITAMFGPEALNLLSTHWIPNLLFFAIFLFFAFSFFGYYEISLPSSWMNNSDRMADKGGLIGTFFMAFTLSLVSFSCTGPIIGSALVESADNPQGPFIVMLGFSTALALPFGLFAAFPAVLNALPKSGSWMNSVKVVLGFLELALALKFFSVADMTMHWGLLKYELFMGLWILTFAAMALYLFGFIKFPHDSPIKKLSIPRIAFGLLSLAITVYLATGFLFNDKIQSYNSLSLMSGLAPPGHYNYFLPESQPDQSIKARYPSFTKCANDLDCFKDYYEGMAYAKEVNQPVLLDFTGYGCVNCRKTEEHIWIKDKVWSKIDKDFVLISLYVDDREKLEKPFISKYTNEKLRMVGNIWGEFQVVNFKQNSQPLYVMVSPDEKVLAKPRGFKDGVEDYANFLSCGLETYQKLSSQNLPGEMENAIGER